MKYKCKDCESILEVTKDVLETDVLRVQSCELCREENYDDGYEDAHEDGRIKGYEDVIFSN